MVNKIAHLADIHIMKNPSRELEYRDVFETLYQSLRNEKPDRIVIVGDFNNDYIEFQGEQLILASDVLRTLSQIAPLRIVRGNHDVRKGNLKRIDSVKAIVESLKLNDLIYYETTGFYDDDNITWAVWNYGDKKVSPWKLQQKNYNKENTTIDLFHESVNGATNVHGFELNAASNIKVSDFMGDMSFFGHIHKKQYLNKEKTKAYPSSLIAQKTDEGDDEFHGYLLWDVKTKKAKEVEIINNYMHFVNITVNVFTDFDDLDIDIPYDVKELRTRIIWNTLPSTKNKINEEKLKSYLNNKYPNITSIAHKKQFIEEDKIDVINEIENGLIFNQEVQERKFGEYLTKIGVEEDIINGVIELDRKIASRIEIEELTNVQWSLIRVFGKNFMSYDDFDIDLRDKDGLIQIIGKNGGGKTTIIKAISYVSYGQTLETETSKKFGDSRFVNNKTNLDYTRCGEIINVNNEFYGILRSTKIERNKAGEIKGSPTKVSYHLLKSADDELTNDNDINNLSEEGKRETQKKIDRIIGTYDNFKRIVITTSDTLNASLSSIKSEFIDSLLFDAGLDIFDKKLEEFKKYNTENVKMLVTCDVDKTNERISQYQQQITQTESEIVSNNNEIDTIKNSIKIGGEFVQQLSSKLYQIDPEIYNMNLESVNNEKLLKQTQLVDLQNEENDLLVKINGLASEFDSEKYNELILKRDTAKERISAIKLDIKNIDNTILSEQHKIEIINGDIFRLTNSGKEKRTQYDTVETNQTNLSNALAGKEDVLCPTCGQIIDKNNIEHLKAEIEKLGNQKNSLKQEMLDIAAQINVKRDLEIPPIQTIIKECQEKIISLDAEINELNVQNETLLGGIGELVNIKNDVEKRNELLTECNKIPLKRENIQLNISMLNTKITNYNNQQIQIEENKKTNQKIEQASIKLNTYNETLVKSINTLNEKKNIIIGLETNIKQSLELIDTFKKQQIEESINTNYKKCIHRDGIPKQMLITQIIPKINKEMAIMLENSNMSVWLDIDDLNLKMCYNSHPEAIIDAISASGMERTFTSIPYKIALNKINAKSKPNFFLLDEIMGKLVDECVDEFIDLLRLIKKSMKLIFIIEHNHEVEPDYVIQVKKINEISNCEFLEV